MFVLTEPLCIKRRLFHHNVPVGIKFFIQVEVRAFAVKAIYSSPLIIDLFHRGMERLNSFELVVEDDMILWRDISRDNIQDERDKGRVLGREPHEITNLSTRVPPRNLLSLLQGTLQDIHRATEEMTASKVIMISPSASPQLLR